eukprot:11048689-Karenia_brevis.AAC.1
MRFLHWSSVGVEQAHASVAVIHRFHPDLETDSLLVRSSLHQVRSLINHNAEPHSSRIAKLQRLLHRLSHKVMARYPPGHVMPKAQRAE